MTWLGLQFVLSLASLCMSARASSYDMAEEQELRTNLTAEYNHKVRPSKSTQVNITLVFLGLNDLNIGEQYMSTTSILYVEWMDARLVWDANTTGVTGLLFDLTEIWIPSLILHNSVGEMDLVGYNRIPFRSLSTGQVIWTPPVIFRTSCEMVVYYFPFERQTCTINLLLYSQGDDDVILRTNDDTGPIDTKYYSANAVWDFQGGGVSEDYLVDSHGKYKILKYSLQFRRRWLFLALTLMLPTIMNLLLMLGVFFLTVESGEKMGYTLTVLLSYIVLLTLVGDSLPQVSTHISILQSYLAVVLIVGCLSTLLTIWVISVFNRDDEKDPISPATQRLVKWVLLPVNTFTFWKVQWQKFNAWRIGLNKKNKISDGSDVWNDLDSNSECKTAETSSRDNSTFIPPIASYAPPSTKLKTHFPGNIANSFDLSVNKDCAQNIPKSSRLDSVQTLKKRTSLSGKSPLDVSTENACAVYSVDSVSLPPTPVTADSIVRAQEMDDIDKILSDITWKDIARMMDSFFLRCLGSLLSLFTLVLIMVLFIQY